MKKKIEEIKDSVDTDLNKIDKSIEQWTWDRYQRIDKSIEQWTWNRYERIEKKLPTMINKMVEQWTWDRYQRIENDLLPKIEMMVAKQTWDRYERLLDNFDVIATKVDALSNVYGGLRCFDVIVPIGNACRPAKHLAENRLRTNAYPLDWMMRYDIGTVKHLFETEFEDYFVECKEDEKESAKLHNNPAHADKRYVIDTKNSIVSIHHFFKNMPFDNAWKNFHIKMDKRAKLMIDRLKKADRILFIGNRNESRDELRDFLETMQKKCFTNGDITLINIRHDASMKEGDPEKIYREDEGGIHFCEYVFNDSNKDESNEWLGNTDKWNQILSNIRLTEKFKDEESKYLRAFTDE